MTVDWTIKDVLEWTARYFAGKAIPQPRLEAEILLASVLGKNRVYLYTNYDSPLNKTERNEYKNFINRRIQKEPTAYITGHKEFMSLDFKVTPDVLIPRPETELLVETALNLIDHIPVKKLCDVGTGSGAIAVSIGYYHPGIDIYATDISRPALSIARENAERHGVELALLWGDLLGPLGNEGQFELIIANLPYISPSQFEQLDPGVKEFEPYMALVSSGDGLDLYRRLIPQCFNRLTDGGYILFEIDPDQTGKINELMTGFDHIEILPDLAGRSRLVKAGKRQ